MPRKQPPLPSKDLTLESISKLNHYQVLGLTEGASSEEVEKSLQVERWPWHLVEEGAREFVTQKRVEAYAVLNDPASRLAYDKEQAYTKGRLAASIGDGTSIWGQAWLVLFGVIAFIMIIGGPYHPARAIGGAFAPGFEEVFVRKDQPCPFPPCADQYKRQFRSTSDFWESLLNGWLPWVAPPLAAVSVGLALRPVVGRVAGYAVASVRYAQRKDGLMRVVMLALTVILPITFVVLYWLLPPDAVQQPPGE